MTREPCSMTVGLRPVAGAAPVPMISPTSGKDFLRALDCTFEQPRAAGSAAQPA